MMLRRVVITGLGVVAPNGIGKDEFWRANIEGRSGVSLITSFDTSKLKSKIAGQIKGFDPQDYLNEKTIDQTDRFAQLGLVAVQLALDDAGCNPGEVYNGQRGRVGISVGSALGGTIFHEEQIIVGLEKGAEKIKASSVPKITPNAVASHIAMAYKIVGPNISISTACASGAFAIGQAAEMIRNGQADMVITGGVEAPLTPFNFGAYASLRVLSRRNDAPAEASRPFDKERDGLVMAEGAGFLILEDLTSARRRGSHIYAEVMGFAQNGGGYHMVMPNPDGHDAALVIEAALKNAEVRPEQVDYINLHGTSTQVGDKIETLAVKKVFGYHAYHIPMSSTKSMIGHTIGAAGAIEAVVCALAIHHGVIPPTINYENQDDECDLDYVPNVARRSRVRIALSNSFGVGNSNAALVLGGGYD